MEDNYVCKRCNCLCYKPVNPGICNECLRVESIIATEPPTREKLLSAIDVCSQLADHIDNQPRRDWTRKADHLRMTIGILRMYLLIVLLPLCSVFSWSCTNGTNDVDLVDLDAELLESSIEIVERDAELLESSIEIVERDAELLESSIEVVERDADLVELDAGTIEPCVYAGIWSIRIAQEILCFIANEPLVLVIRNCNQLDISQPLEISDPLIGDFTGSITYHIESQTENTLTGTANVVGVLSQYGQARECSTHATIAGSKADETR